MNTDQSKVANAANKNPYQNPSAAKPNSSNDFIQHYAHNTPDKGKRGTSLKRVGNQIPTYDGSSKNNSTSLQHPIGQVANIQLLNGNSALGVNHKHVINEEGTMFQTIARDQESKMANLQNPNDLSAGAYGNFIQSKVGSGSPKKVPLMQAPLGESFSKNSPLKRSEEFKVHNKGGITSEMSFAPPTQLNSSGAGISLNKESSNNQYRTMIIAEMLTQQHSQKQQQLMFSDASAYNGYTNTQHKNASYFSNPSSVSHQTSGMQVKLPQIRNQKDNEPSSSSNFRSPQCLSHQMDRELLVSESEKRFLEQSQIFNQTRPIENAGKTMHGLKFNVQIPQQEVMSLKKAVNMTKKVTGSNNSHNNHLTEEMIMRNARFHSSANHSNNNQNTLNHLLFGSQNVMPNSIQTPHAANLQVSGHKHDILMQEGRKNPSLQKPPTHHGHNNSHNIPMQQIKLLQQQANYQQVPHTSHMLTPQVLVKKQYNQHLGIGVGGVGGMKISDSGDGAPLVVINKMSTPTNYAKAQSKERFQQKQSSVVQSDYSSSMIQQQQSQQKVKGGLNHYDSQKSTLFDSTQQRDQIYVQNGDSKLGMYNPNSQNSPGTLTSERMTQKQEIQSEYLSPKLLYKKKKRDFYNQPIIKHGQILTGNTNIHPLNPSSLGKNHFMSAKDQTVLKHGNQHTINHLINQLVNKPGSNQQSVMQALKNIAGIQTNKDYPALSANEALEVISRAIQSQGESGKYLPSLGRSVSQEILQDNISHTYSREEINNIEGGTQKLKSKNGKILNANELYELAKQNKYKQYQQQQQLQADKRKNNMSIYTNAVPLMMDKDQSKLMMIDAINVVKLKASSDSVDRINQRDSQMQSQSPDHNNHHHNYLLQLKNNQMGSKHTVQGKDRGNGNNLKFVFRYMNNNNEMVILPDDTNNQLFAQRIEQDFQNRDSSRNSQTKKSKVVGIREDEPLHQGIMIQGLQAQGTGFTDSKLKMVLQQSIDSVVSSASGNKQTKLRSSVIGGNAGMLISSIHQMNEEQKSKQMITPGRGDPNDDYNQNLSFGQPIIQIGDSQQFIQQASIQEQNPTNYYIKEFMKNRNQRKSVKQAQLAKISRIQDLEKLLMMQPGFEDAPVLNTNPGGGGRVVNRADAKVANPAANQQIIPLKRRIEPQITDNENEIMCEHPINKTIKMITILNQLLFKGLKEFNSVQQEILNRCTRYFHFQIPKQFKQELPTLVKQKDFLSTVRERMYTTLYNSINKANGITEKTITANQALGTFKYYIGGGNNHMLVKQVFKQRNWWIQCEKESFDECNFMWTQWLKDRHIKALPSFFDKKPSEEPEDANFQDPQEQESQLPAESIKIYNKMHDNHCLSDKKHLFFNMRDLYQAEGKDLFNVMPLTYVINDGLNDIEFDKFEAQFQAIQESIKPSQNTINSMPDTIVPTSTITEQQLQPEPQIQVLPKQQHNVWIIKPGEDTNRGSGIIVSKDFNEIKQLVRDKSSKANRTAILQKYIENPLLINKRKFDIRCYGLMTSINGNMLGFFYQDGYLRTSSKEFSVQNLNNKYIHLTNDAIQKNSEDYGKFENANKLSYQDFDRYFAENQFQDYEIRFQRDFLPQIRAIVRDTFRAAEKKIDPQRRMNTFEVFGYDFMIDDDLKLKLIEVNTNPSIEICCPLLARIVPSMLESVFKIAIDPLFQQPPNRRIWSSTEAITDLKMELVFESTAASSSNQEVQQTENDVLASLTNFAEVTPNKTMQF